MAAPEGLLTLEVATPRGLVLRAQCESVQAPSVHGEFGVLPGHLPLLAALRSGLLKYRTEGRDHVAAVGPGFIEAGPDKVLLLTELYAAHEKVDVESVKKELAEAEQRLAKFGDLHEGPEYKELARDIEWAQARLEVARQANH